MNKFVFIPLIASFVIITSCNNQSNPSSSSDSYQYDENWTPGPNAIKGATQPTVKNPQGVYNNLGKMRKSQNRSGLPQQGQGNILVVPLEFYGDSQYGYNLGSDDINTLKNVYFDNPGSSTSLPSVTNYYEQSSYNKLKLSGVVAPIVSAENDFESYLYEAIYFGLSKVVKEITEYVYDYLFETTKTYYLQDFDADDNGKIDSLVLAYSWYPYDAYYGYEIYDYVVYLLSHNVFFGEQIGLSCPVDSIAWTSAITSEITRVNSDSHVAIQQIGQMMGIEDYQDTTGNLEGTYRSPLAHRDMMDGRIGDHNPFTKYQLGWINPTTVFADVLVDSETYTLKPYEEDGSALLLAPEQTGMYGEYLMVEYYTPTGLNQPDSKSTYPYNYYGNRGYTKKGIRVYKVDARLVEGSSSTDVSLADNEPDFNKQITLSNGKKTSVYYDYAYSNNGINEYGDSGIYEDYALVSELSKKGFNRHMVDSTFALSNDDLFFQGDAFGKEDDIDGFYTNYAFNGSGVNEVKLGLTFTVDSITDTAATITIRRAK